MQFALLESSSVDDDLANLKKELSGASKVLPTLPVNLSMELCFFHLTDLSLHTAFKQKGELPPGRSPMATNSAFPFQDTEIEKELNELRRKAKEF